MYSLFHLFIIYFLIPPAPAGELTMIIILLCANPARSGQLHDLLFYNLF